MQLNKSRVWQYLILAARVLLAFTFLNYGFAKLAGGQFGISAREMNMPLKDVSLFKLFWYLMDFNPFKYFIASFQILSGCLLLFNRTAIIGAFLFLPIIINILVMNITFIKMPGFYDRLGWYILLDLLIIYHYRGKVKQVFLMLTKKDINSIRFPLWIYFTLPVAAILLDLILVFPRILFMLTSDPLKLIQSMREFIRLIHF